MTDIQKLNVNNTTYDISTTWDKVTGKPTTFPPVSHTHSYLPTIQVAQEQESNDDWIKSHALSTLRGHVYNTHGLEWQYLFGISSSKTYGSILRTSYGKGTPRLQVMGLNGGTWSNWREVSYDGHTHTFTSLTSKPTTLSGYGITDNVAYRQTWNNFIHAGNEFTFASPAQKGSIYINYRTSSGDRDGAITDYHFNNGAGLYANICAAKYIINGGTSSQFLKGDGSLDSNTYLNTTNYNSYAPTLTGTGASGTWGISISGNASSASKLATARKIWGQSFDGTSDVNGNAHITGDLIVDGEVSALVA